MSDYFISYIRTLVPIIVGSAVAWLAMHNFKLDQATIDGLTAGLTGLSIALYYLIVRTLERFASPKFGWLLGYAKNPTYSAAPATQSGR